MGYDLIENYIYLFHTKEFLIIPVYPESVTDTMSSTFNTQYALARSAPMYSYAYSGPRQFQISITLHRDLMDDVNTGRSNFKVDLGDDYIDSLIKKIQAITLPKYSSSNKSVEPPMIAVRFGNDIFIKGVVNGSLSVSYSGPILKNNKWAVVTISFTVYEVDPYDAESVSQLGSFRGLTKTMASMFNHK